MVADKESKGIKKSDKIGQKAFIYRDLADRRELTFEEIKWLCQCDSDILISH